MRVILYGTHSFRLFDHPDMGDVCFQCGLSEKTSIHAEEVSDE